MCKYPLNEVIIEVFITDHVHFVLCYQDDVNVVFDDKKWKPVEDTLIATKLRRLYIHSFSSTIFGDHFMSRVTQAVFRRHCKELMTIQYDTIRAGVLCMFILSEL